MKAVKKWTFVPADTEVDCDEPSGLRITCSADIKDPRGHSIFSVDLGDFYGISTATAKRIVDLLNCPIPKKRKRS